MGAPFEWSTSKAEANRRKHGVSFTEAATAFRDPLAITRDDVVHSQEEERYLLIGRSRFGRILVIAHTERAGRIRLISAREATRRETRAYEEGE